MIIDNFKIFKYEFPVGSGYEDACGWNCNYSTSFKWKEVAEGDIFIDAILTSFYQADKKIHDYWFEFTRELTNIFYYKKNGKIQYIICEILIRSKDPSHKGTGYDPIKTKLFFYSDKFPSSPSSSRIKLSNYLDNAKSYYRNEIINSILE